MKIALVCPYDWARHGGVRIHVAALAAQLADDHEVRVLAPSSQRADAPAVHDAGVSPRQLTLLGPPVRVPYNRSVAPISLSPLAGRRLLHALRTFEPHVVHVHEPVVPLLSLLATTRGPRPVVGTFHAWAASSRLYRAAAPFARRAVRRLSARIAVSRAAREYAATSLGLSESDFQIIPNGVDTAAFGNAEPLPELQDPSRPLVLFVGRLEPRKGLDIAIRAFLRLRSSLPSARLCVVGDGPERDRCQQMVPPSIRPDVLFVGVVAQRDLPRYYASADVLLSPATGGESFGIVLLEGMAAGLPVVASALPGYRTVMVDGRQGLLVKPGDAFACADALHTVLANAALARAMGEEGRRTAADYAWPVVAGRLVEVYRAALRGR